MGSPTTSMEAPCETAESGRGIGDGALVLLHDPLPIIDAERPDVQIGVKFVADLTDVIDPIELVKTRKPRAVLGLSDQLDFFRQTFVFSKASEHGAPEPVGHRVTYKGDMQRRRRLGPDRAHGGESDGGGENRGEPAAGQFG
jgi:hypothetical protein